MNVVHLLGNLGNEIEIKRFDGGGCVGNVSMATNKSYKNKAGEKVKETQWHRLVFRDKMAETIEKYCKKGDKILVTGEIKNRSYQVENETRMITEISVSNFEFVSSNGTGAENQTNESTSANTNNNEEQDDLPF